MYFWRNGEDFEWQQYPFVWYLSIHTQKSSVHAIVSLVLLPSEWRDIPVKHVTGRSEQADHRAFEGNYTTFFSNILILTAVGYLRKITLKKEYSRKKTCSYWRGNALWKYGDVGVDLVIDNREQGVLKIKFSNDIY